MKKEKKKKLIKKPGQDPVIRQEIKKPVKFTVNHKAGILLALISFLLFSNTIGFEYVLDDAASVTQNVYVQKGFAGIPDILTTDFWQFYNLQLGYYRPLSVVTFAIEYQFFKGDPHVSHLVNILIFAFTSYILFILLSKIFRRKNFLFPFFICLLFIVHPIHTEVIANVKSRDELMSFLNVLLMIWFSLKYQESGKLTHVLLSMFFFYLALLSKETAMVGILLIPVILFFTGDHPIPSLIKKTIPYLAILALFFMQKKMLLGSFGGIVPDDIVNYPYKDLAVKTAMAFYFFAFGLKLLFIPHPLRYDYSYNQIPGVGFSDPVVLAGLFLFIAGIVVILKKYKSRSPFVLGILVLFVTSLPMMAFTILRGGIFAERFLFYPSLGFSISFIAVLGILLKKDFQQNFPGLKNLVPSSIVLPVIVLSVCILFSIKTFTRNYAWKNESTLFGTDIKSGENSVQNLRHWGTEVMKMAISEKDTVKKKEYTAEALRIFKRAVQVHPKFGEIYNQLGVLYQEVYGNLDSSMKYFKLSMETAPSLPFPVFNLGVAYQRKGMNSMASFYYNETLKISPQYKEAITARDNLKQATGLDIRMNPMGAALDTTSTNKNSQYYYDRGIYYSTQGDYAKAAEEYGKSINLDSSMEGSYINLANCLGMLKEYDKSIKISELWLRRNPNDFKALQNLAVTYRLLGDNQKADEYANRAKAVGN